MKIRSKILLLLALCLAPGAVYAISYGMVAAGVLVAAVGVLAAPAVTVVVGSAAVASLAGSVAFHVGAAIAITGLLWPSDVPPKVQQSQNVGSAKPISVQLAPMTPAQKSQFQQVKQKAAVAKATHPKPATPASGDGSAKSQAAAQVQPAVDWYNQQLASYGVSDKIQAVPACQLDSTGSSYSCSVQYKGDPAYANDFNAAAQNFPYDKMKPYGSASFTPGSPAVTCPTGSHQSGDTCQLDQNVTAPAVVNDGTTPQWDPEGIPQDATLSDDGKTLSRSVQNGDGSVTRTDVVLQPDGSMDVVNSNYDPSTNQTSHTGYAVDTGQQVVSVAGGVSPGNRTTTPGSSISMPTGSGTGSGTGDKGDGSGSCGGPGQSPCTIDDSGFKDGAGQVGVQIGQLNGAVDGIGQNLSNAAIDGNHGIGFDWMPSLLPGSAVACTALSYTISTDSLGIGKLTGDMKIDICDKLDLVRQLLGYFFGLFTIFRIYRLFTRSNGMAGG